LSVQTREKARPAKNTASPRTIMLTSVFKPPRIVEVEAETVPVRTILVEGAHSLVKARRTRIISTTASNARSLLERVGEPRRPSFPRWTGWYAGSRAVEIGKVVNLIISKMFPDEGIEPTDFTDKKYLSEPFKVSRQLHEAVRSRDKLKSVVFVNVEGGVDIYSAVSSSDETTTYYQVVSVGRGEDGEPVVRATCSCPTTGTICKHLVSSIAAHIPEVFGAVRAVREGVPPNAYIEEYRVRQTVLARELEALSREHENVWDAYIYYMVKLLKNRGILTTYKLKDHYRDEYISTVKRVVEARTLPKHLSSHVKYKVEQTVTLAREYRVVWTEEMKALRETLLGFIRDLGVRFGRRSGVSAWARMLAFAVVMSADYLKAPIVVHAVGDVGTFKTTGAKLIAEYVRVPELVVASSRGDPRAAYEDIVMTVARALDVPASSILFRVGGLVSSVTRKGDRVEVAFNLPFVLSILSARGDKGAATYNSLLSELRKRGYEVLFRVSGARADVKDHMQLARIENYRFTYVPDEKLGLLTKSDVFDNYVLVVDEGSRNPEALEGMLTKMSLAGLTEGVRIIIVTDNLEPHVEMVRNPRYAPLYDRMFLVFTSGVVDEVTVMENLFREPTVRFDGVALLAAARFVDAIPVNEEKVYLIKSVGNSLSYTFTLSAAPDGSKFVVPLRRGEKAPIIIDVFSGLGDFDFYPGGRFTVHTMLLSKFNAFLRGGDHAEDVDVKKALATTVASRLVVDVSTYSDYKGVVMRVADAVSDAYDRMRDALPEVAQLAALLREGKYGDAEKLFESLLTRASDDPVYAPLLMSVLELYAAVNDVNLDELPRPIAYTIAGILLVKGDTEALEGTRTLRELLELRREADVVG